MHRRTIGVIPDWKDRPAKTRMTLESTQCRRRRMNHARSLRYVAALSERDLP